MIATARSLPLVNALVLVGLTVLAWQIGRSLSEWRDARRREVTGLIRELGRANPVRRPVVRDATVAELEAMWARPAFYDQDRSAS